MKSYYSASWCGAVVTEKMRFSLSLVVLADHNENFCAWESLKSLSSCLIFQRGSNGLKRFPHIFQFSYPFVSTYTIDNRWHYKMILHILLGHIGNDLVETQSNSRLYEATFATTFFDLFLFFSYYRLTFLSRCLPTSNFPAMCSLG